MGDLIVERSVSPPPQSVEITIGELSASSSRHNADFSGKGGEPTSDVAAIRYVLAYVANRH